jgi:hypothetical protein
MVHPDQGVKMLSAGAEVTLVGLSANLRNGAQRMPKHGEDTAEAERCFATLSVRITQKAVLAGQGLSFEEGICQDSPRLQRICASQDFLEGPMACAEKRAPRWKSR